jgi:hypothetical protein
MRISGELRAFVPVVSDDGRQHGATGKSLRSVKTSESSSWLPSTCGPARSRPQSRRSGICSPRWATTLTNAAMTGASVAGGRLDATVARPAVRRSRLGVDRSDGFVAFDILLPIETSLTLRVSWEVAWRHG